jgi:hypothetical protein
LDKEKDLANVFANISQLGSPNVLGSGVWELSDSVAFALFSFFSRLPW